MATAYDAGRSRAERPGQYGLQVPDNAFENVPRPVADLPRLSDDHFEPVDGNYLRVSLSVIAGLGVLCVGAGVAGSLLVSTNAWVPLAVMAAVLVLLCLSAVLSILEVRNMGYQVRTHDVSYRSGVFIKRVSTVPFVRVQHVRTRQGPLQRRFGFATLEVNSAGPDLAIKGLTTEVAEQMKALIAERAGDLVEQE